METGSTVDGETVTPASFQALETSTQLADRLEMWILFCWHSSLAVVLGLKMQLDRFEQIRHVVFQIEDWQHSTLTVISFWVLPACHNAWMMAFRAYDKFLTIPNPIGYNYALNWKFHSFYTNTLTQRIL